MVDIAAMKHVGHSGPFSTLASQRIEIRLSTSTQRTLTSAGVASVSVFIELAVLRNSLLLGQKRFSVSI